jgi:hypothetical protein
MDFSLNEPTFSWKEQAVQGLVINAGRETEILSIGVSRTQLFRRLYANIYHTFTGNTTPMHFFAEFRIQKKPVGRLLLAMGNASGNVPAGFFFRSYHSIPYDWQGAYASTAQRNEGQVIHHFRDISNTVHAFQLLPIYLTADCDEIVLVAGNQWTGAPVTLDTMYLACLSSSQR